MKSEHRRPRHTRPQQLSAPEAATLHTLDGAKGHEDREQEETLETWQCLRATLPLTLLNTFEVAMRYSKHLKILHPIQVAEDIRDRRLLGTNQELLRSRLLDRAISTESQTGAGNEREFGDSFLKQAPT